MPCLARDEEADDGGNVFRAPRFSARDRHLAIRPDNGYGRLLLRPGIRILIDTRFNLTGADGIDAEVVLREFESQLLHHCDLRCLGGGVGRNTGRGERPRAIGRGDDDDRIATGGLQVGTQ